MPISATPTPFVASTYERSTRSESAASADMPVSYLFTLTYKISGSAFESAASASSAIPAEVASD